MAIVVENDGTAQSGDLPFTLSKVMGCTGVVTASGLGSLKSVDRSPTHSPHPHPRPDTSTAPLGLLNISSSSKPQELQQNLSKLKSHRVARRAAYITP